MTDLTLMYCFLSLSMHGKYQLDIWYKCIERKCVILPFLGPFWVIITCYIGHHSTNKYRPSCFLHNMHTVYYNKLSHERARSSTLTVRFLANCKPDPALHHFNPAFTGGVAFWLPYVYWTWHCYHWSNSFHIQYSFAKIFKTSAHFIVFGGQWVIFL